MDELIGHQRQPWQLRDRIAAVDVAVDLPGELPVEGSAGGAVADHRGAERADLLNGDEFPLQQPRGDQRQRPPEAVAGDPDGTVALFHLRFDRRQEDRPDRRDRVDEALVEAGPDTGGGEIEAEAPLRHDEEIHRVGDIGVPHLEDFRAGLRGEDRVIAPVPARQNKRWSAVDDPLPFRAPHDRKVEMLGDQRHGPNHEPGREEGGGAEEPAPLRPPQQHPQAAAYEDEQPRRRQEEADENEDSADLFAHRERSLRRALESCRVGAWPTQSYQAGGRSMSVAPPDNTVTPPPGSAGRVPCDRAWRRAAPSSPPARPRGAAGQR